MFSYQEKIAVVAAVIILCMYLPSGDAKLETRPCQAKWNLLADYSNSLRVAFNYEFRYRVGLHNPQASHRPYGEKEPETIATVTVQVPASVWNRSLTEVKKSNSALTGVIEKTGKIAVRPRESVKIWQLIVESGSQIFGFDNIVSDLEPQAEVSSCLATYNVRELIQSYSRVRLRHESTGMYMVVTHRKGWNAATLDYSRSYYFQFTSIGSSYTRIITETYQYSGYRYLYSSTFGGIYFDEYDGSSDKQEWTLSSSNPRDGDAVTIHSVRWPGAYIKYFSGYTPSVYCDYTSYPDRWIIELVQ